MEAIEAMTGEEALAKVKPAPLVRPLEVLIPLIKEDLEAAKEAGAPYFRAAGEKLWEAKAQFTTEEIRRGDWVRWLERNFGLSVKTARTYMQFANHVQFQLIANEQRAADRQVPLPKTLSEVTDPRHADNNKRHNPEWYKPVQEGVSRLNVPRMRQEAQDREKEAALRRKLGLQLIDIGYKVLATKLHPDRGGSAVAMARLNKVREILKGAL